MNNSAGLSIVILLSTVATVGGILTGRYLSLSSSRTAIKNMQDQLNGKLSGQYRQGVKVTSLRIIGLELGNGKVYDIGKLLSFTGQIYKQRPVQFVTEQNGYGQIYASFNSHNVKCTGIHGARRKTCTVEASMRPWSGRFKVWTFSDGRQPSAGFQMAANAVCEKAGLEGDNCDQDIDECKKFKDRRICAWKDGCVNTFGSYTCRCPDGYTVSKADFRNCDALLPEISSKSQMLTVLYKHPVELPCQYSGPPLRQRTWARGAQRVTVETKAGVLLPDVVPQRFSLSTNGTLRISSTLFGDAGVYTCQVQTTAGITTRRAHMVKVESKPLIGIRFLTNGSYVSSKEHKVGDTIVAECQALTIPLGTQQWTDQAGKPVVESKRIKLISGRLRGQNSGAIYTRLQISNAAVTDSGLYTCRATNARGAASLAVSINVKS